MAYRDFTVGQVLTSQQVDEFLMRQTVMVFADSAARATALSGVLVQGMLTYLVDTSAYESWNGSAFVNINDNTDAIPKSTVTTSQDLIVADGASSVTRLGVGTNDQVLSVVAGEVAWADTGTTVSEQGTSRAIVAGDANSFIYATAAITITVDDELAIGESVNFIQNTAGAITFAAGAGVTLNSKEALLNTNGQFTGASLTKKATNSYYLIGDLA
jgi:hypothetical protein